MVFEFCSYHTIKSLHHQPFSRSQRPLSPAPDRWCDECQGAKRPAFGVTAGRCSVTALLALYYPAGIKVNLIPVDSQNSLNFRISFSELKSGSPPILQSLGAHVSVESLGQFFKKFFNPSIVLKPVPPLTTKTNCRGSPASAIQASVMVRFSGFRFTSCACEGNNVPHRARKSSSRFI